MVASSVASSAASAAGEMDISLAMEPSPCAHCYSDYPHPRACVLA
jgi:hypothetical protein